MFEAARHATLRGAREVNREQRPKIGPPRLIRHVSCGARREDISGEHGAD